MVILKTNPIELTPKVDVRLSIIVKQISAFFFKNFFILFHNKDSLVYFSVTVFIWIMTIVFSVEISAQVKNNNKFKSKTKKNYLRDSLISPVDTLNSDSLHLAKHTKTDPDSLVLDSLKRNSELKAQLKYQANDSIVFDMDKKTMYLYDKARTEFQDQILESKYIRVEWDKNMIHAEGAYDAEKDSLYDTPIFKEKDQTYKAEKITYNIKTRKGKIAYANTQQGTDFIIGDSIKKNPDNTFFIKDGKFTTCDHPHPHFYIKSKKLKMIPNDRIVSGPLYMVIADVPIPIILPFGFFPFNKSRTSGIMLPQYGETMDRGFFFRDMGYYWAINNYADLTFKANIYTNGSYQLSFEPRYKLRYKFDGSLYFSYMRNIFNEEGDPDFRTDKNYILRWQHRQPINPNASLNASVDIGSSNFYQQTIANNINQNLRTTLNSSIAYQHRFNRIGWSLTASLNHTQDVQTKLMTLTAPSMTFNKDRFFPFSRKKSSSKKKWYEQIGISYSSAITNQITIPDSLLLTQEVVKKMRNGWNHNASMNTSFKVLQYININPSISYNEYWYTKTIDPNYRSYNYDSVVSTNEMDRVYTISKNKVFEDTKNGFSAARDFNFSIGMNTMLYGIMQLKGKKQMAFRHTLTPNIGYFYRPDFSKEFWGYYKNVQINEQGQTRKYSRFQNSVIGGPSAGEQQNISFGITNTVEMKYLPKMNPDDTAKPTFKRITLLDNFNIGGSYNFAADSFRLSNLGFSFRTNILNNLINLNFSGTLDPYAYKYLEYQNRIVRTKDYTWDFGTLPRITNLSMSTSFKFKSKEKKSKTKDGKEEKSKSKQGPIEENGLLYEDFNLPWSLDIGYTGSYTLLPAIKGNAFEKRFINSVNLSGHVMLTTKWKITMSTNLDLGGEKLFGVTNVRVDRDLHCWVLGIDIVPFGMFRRYVMNINVKAPTLQDLRIQKQRQWQDRFGAF